MDGDIEEGEILLNSGLESSQLVTTDDLAVQDWIMDSGASFHVTPHCEWFTSYDAKRTRQLHLGNDHACEIKGVGDVKLKFQQGSTFILAGVYLHSKECSTCTTVDQELDFKGTTG